MPFAPLHSRRALLTALSLNLAALAGCAAPATMPVAVSNAAAPAPEAAPAQALAAAPAAPAAEAAPAVAAALPLSGKVSFNGEYLAGYALSATNPLTGAALALTGQAVTDARGGFSVQVAGLQAGAPVRLVATKDLVKIEATFQAASGAAVSLDEAATTLSLIQAGPLQVAGLLSAEAAAPVADAYMKAVAGMSAPVATQLSSANVLAGAIVRRPENAKDQLFAESAVESVVANANQAGALTDATLALVKSVATAPHANQFATFSVLAAGPSFVRFLGTKLKAGVGGEGGGVQLANVKTGKLLDARTTDAATLKKASTANKVHHKKVTGPFTSDFLAHYTDAEAGVPVFVWMPLDGDAPDTHELQLGCFTSGTLNGQKYVDFNVLSGSKANEYLAATFDKLQHPETLAPEDTYVSSTNVGADFSRLMRFNINPAGQVDAIQLDEDLFITTVPFTAKAGDQHTGPLFDAVTGYLFDYQVPTLDEDDNPLGNETIRAGFGVDQDGILAMVNGLSRLAAATVAEGQAYPTVPLIYGNHVDDSCATYIHLQQGVAMRADAIVKAVSPSLILQWLGVSKLEPVAPPPPPSDAI